MKIEPGTLCIVKSTMRDNMLNGRIVVAKRWIQPGEKMKTEKYRMWFIMTAPGEWGCTAPNGEPLFISFNNAPTGETDRFIEVCPIPAQELIPISGPGLDLSEKWEREIEDDVDEAGFKAKHWKRIADMAGDDTWD
jgi:hypothetical protein